MREEPNNIKPCNTRHSQQQLSNSINIPSNIVNYSNMVQIKNPTYNSQMNNIDRWLILILISYQNIFRLNSKVIKGGSPSTKDNSNRSYKYMNHPEFLINVSSGKSTTCFNLFSSFSETAYFTYYWR